MQILASLVDFVHHAQQRRRREGKGFPFHGARGNGSLVQHQPAIAEGAQKSRTKIPDGLAHGYHELRRIGFDIEFALDGHHRLVRVQRTVPLELLLASALVAGRRLRYQLVHDLDIPHVGHDRHADRIALGITRLDADYRAVVVELQGRHLGTVIVVEKVTAPKFGFPGRSKERRVEHHAAADGIDAERLDGIGHRVENEHRVSVIACRNIRVAFAAHVHFAGKNIALLVTYQPKLCLRGIIERQKMKRGRRRERLHRARGRKIFVGIHVQEFRARAHRTDGKPEFHFGNHGIDVGLIRCEIEPRKERRNRKQENNNQPIQEPQTQPLTFCDEPSKQSSKQKQRLQQG